MDGHLDVDGLLVGLTEFEVGFDVVMSCLLVAYVLLAFTWVAAGKGHKQGM